MQVSVNSEPVSIPDTLETVGDAVRFVERDVLPDQHVITKVVVDGAEVTGLQEDGAALSREASGCSLEIYSARAVDVAKEGLVDAMQLLPLLVDELPQSADDLTGGEVEAGLDRFARCMETISWYVNLIGAVEYLLTDGGIGAGPDEISDVDDLSPENADLSGWPGEEEGLLSFASVENLRQKLLDMQQAQLTNDPELLANMIQYEILPIVQIWVKELPTMVSRVSRLGNVA